jgi:hypothetical protein
MFSAINPKTSNNFLIRAQVAINNFDKYLHFDNVDHIITEQLQNLNYNKLFLNQPSQKSTGSTFKPSESELIKEDVTGVPKYLANKKFPRPSEILKDEKEQKVTKEDFLNNKRRRANKSINLSG